MPNIRTTHVSLLVDREVDRDIRVTSLYALIDRVSAVNINITEFYLIADIENGPWWTDNFNQTDEFDFELVSSGSIFLDTWIHTDLFKSYRGDLWELYQNIVTWIGTGTPPPPTEYDIDENGSVDAFDSDLVLTWYDTGVLEKPLRTSWSQTQLFHNWPSVPRALTLAWTQTDVFQPSLQRLGFTDTFAQTENWYNPGDVEVTLFNTQTQLDSYTVQSDLKSWADHLTFQQSFDTQKPVRSWSDIFNQTESWSDSNISQHWTQSDGFAQGETLLNLRPRMYWYDRFKLPEERQISQNWSTTELWYTGIITDSLTEVWSQTDIFHPSIQSVHFENLAIDVVDLNGNVLVFGMVAWLTCDHHKLRNSSDTINWFEDWRVILPEVNLETTQTFTDTFEANPLWDDLSDTQTFTETWDQLSGYFLDPITFQQTSTFERQHDPNLYLSTTWSQDENFNFYQTPNCITPYGLFTLIDSTESLVLRNAEWMDSIQLHQQRAVGQSRSGTPYVRRMPYWPQRKSYFYRIKTLSDPLFDQVLNFLERNIGKQIWWIDHYGVRHRGYCADPAAVVTRVSNHRGSIELELVDIGGAQADIIQHLFMEDILAWQ